jgi:Immunoglobulin-like domain of bacterial spore germination
MYTFSSKHRNNLLIGPAVLLLLALLLVACSSVGSGSNGSSTPTVGNTSTTPIASQSPGVKLGVQTCPAAVKDPSHWTSIINPGTGAKVESVSCANLIGNPSLQALVTVRSEGSAGILHVYVYNNITSVSPTQIFKLQYLDSGDARVSGYNTIITGEIDTSSSINIHAKGDASLVQDLFREFKWSDGAGTFVAVTFPGIFPDLTRYQAETAQAQVNQGHQPWRLSAIMTSQTLAAGLLKWNPDTPATIVSGGGNHDTDAVVTVKSTNPGSGSITVTLSRLEGNSNGGIWEATSVTSNGMSITSPMNRDRLTSPITVTGTGNAFEGKIGTVKVLDHLYTDIGHAGAIGASGNGNTTFSTTVTYTSSATSGTISKSPTEEGVVALYAYSNADGSIRGAVMVKALLNA